MGLNSCLNCPLALQISLFFIILAALEVLPRVCVLFEEGVEIIM